MARRRTARIVLRAVRAFSGSRIHGGKAMLLNHDSAIEVSDDPYRRHEVSALLARAFVRTSNSPFGSATGPQVSGYLRDAVAMASSKGVVFRNADSTASAVCLRVPRSVLSRTYLSLQLKWMSIRWLGVDAYFCCGRRYAITRPPIGPYWYLWFIAVSPEAQGMGVGGAFLAGVLRRLGAEGLPVRLHTSSEAANFFVHNGLRIVGREVGGDGIDRIVEMASSGT